MAEADPERPSCNQLSYIRCYKKIYMRLFRLQQQLFNTLYAGAKLVTALVNG